MPKQPRDYAAEREREKERYRPYSAKIERAVADRFDELMEADGLSFRPWLTARMVDFIAIHDGAQRAKALLDKFSPIPRTRKPRKTDSET